MTKLMLTLLALMSLTTTSCRQASYGFTKKPKQEKVDPKPVLPPSVPVAAGPHEFWGENGFHMICTPPTAKAGEVVTCEGTCGNDADQELAWQFGDGQSGRGNKTTHVFREVRKFNIDATCTDKAGKIRRGTVVIDVVPGSIGNPGQRPGQNSTPGQNPAQKV